MGYLLAQADAARIPIADRSVDLVIGSPPYVDARKYLEAGVDLGISRQCDEWIEWMLGVTAEALRVSRGAVIWVVAGVTRGRNYQPAPEGLLYRWWQMGGHAYRPCYWHRSGVPGSGGDQWFRAVIEYAMCFKRPGELPWAENTAIGHPSVCQVGGPVGYRSADGNRINRPVIRGVGGRRRNGMSKKYEPWSILRGYTQPDIANPGNLISTGMTGKGKLGHDLAHENEAPFPEDVAEFFIRSLCPPGGICLDPFSGSGTTASVATRLGRHAIGLDIRQSQCELGGRRIAEQLLDLDRPHRPKAKARAGSNGQPPAPLPLFPEDAQ